MGPDGLDGCNGTDGRAGSPGIPGVHGERGPPGPMGDYGPIGEPGDGGINSVGVKGVRGNPGMNGLEVIVLFSTRISLSSSVTLLLYLLLYLYYIWTRDRDRWKYVGQVCIERKGRKRFAVGGYREGYRRGTAGNSYGAKRVATIEVLETWRECGDAAEISSSVRTTLKNLNLFVSRLRDRSIKKNSIFSASATILIHAYLSTFIVRIEIYLLYFHI